MQQRKLMQQTDSSPLNIVITGGNSGIGLETARALYKLGHNVIFGSRNTQRNAQAVLDIKSNSFGKGSIKGLKLDLSKRRSIEIFSQQVKSRFKCIDQLINNAGIMLYEKQISELDAEMTMTVNHFGHFYLTFLLFEQLKKSEQARIINITGELYNFYKWNPENYYQDLEYNNQGNEYNYLRSYALSKLANVHFTQGLAKRCEDYSNIKSICIHPGVVDTNFAHSFAQKNCFLRILDKIVFSCCCCLFISAQEGAQGIIHGSTVPYQSLPNGCLYSGTKETTIAPVGLNKRQIERLWAKSQQVYNIKFDIQGGVIKQSAKSESSLQE